MVPQHEGLRKRRPDWAPLAVVLAVVGGMLALFQAFGTGPSRDDDEEPPLQVVGGGPFGPSLDAALAYVGRDRVVYLIDLRDGDRLGSKAIPNERRPAAASSTHLYLGRLTKAARQANWDSWRSLPWEGTRYRDLGPGNWVAFWPSLDAVVAAMSPLPEGGGGVRLLADPPIDLMVSGGVWGALTPVGDTVLAREWSGAGEWWWLLAPGRKPLRVVLPLGFQPLAGAPGLVAGRVGGAGVVVALPGGTTRPLSGPVGVGADWDPEGTLLAVVTGDPAALSVYDAAGALVWRRLLTGPASALGSGVAWSPDGEFLVFADGDTLAAYARDGERIGAMDTLQPPPEVAAAWVRLLPLPVLTGEEAAAEVSGPGAAAPSR